MKYTKSLLCLAVLILTGTIASRAQNLYAVNQNGAGAYVTAFDPSGNFLGVVATNTGTQGIAFDPSGDFYVASGSSDGNVAKYAADGTLINSAFITTSYTYNDDLFGPLTEPLKIFGLAFDANSNLFVSDLSYGFIQNYNTNGSLINSSFFQTASSAFALAFGPNGNLYISDLYGNRLYQISPNGTQISSVSTSSNPNGIAVDKSGYVYVAIPDQGLVKKYDADLNSVSNFVSDLNNPYGLVFDGGGNLYVSDLYTNRIYKYDANGVLLNTLTNALLLRPGFMAIGPSTSPVLGITAITNNPVVVWPASATNYVLQMNTDLTSTNWMTVTNGVPFVGVMMTNAPANAFFRLKKVN